MWRDTSLKVSRHILPYSGRTSGIGGTYPKLRMRKNIVIGSPKGRFLRFFFDEFAIQIQTSIIHLKFYLSRSAHNDSRTFMILSPTFWEKVPRFLENVQRFLENVRCFYWMLGEVWISLQRSVLSCSRFSSFPPLSRVRVRAHPTFLHFLLSQPSQKWV